MTRDSIVERVRKLLALASNNPNVNEAGVAAAQAQRLMLEHKIAQLDIEADADADEIEVGRLDVSSTFRPVQQWRRELASILAPLCFIKVIITNTRTGSKTRSILHAIGTTDDTAVFAQLFSYLEKQIHRLSVEAGGARASATWLTQFRRGAVRGVNAKLAELARQVVSDTRVMVVFDRSKAANEKFVDQEFADFPTVDRKPRALVVQDAAIEGLRAGYGIDVQLPGQIRKLKENDQ